MDKPTKDKAIKNREDIKKISKKKRKFFFPEKGVIVEAENVEEATKKTL